MKILKEVLSAKEGASWSDDDFEVDELEKNVFLGNENLNETLYFQTITQTYDLKFHPNRISL